MQLDDVGHVAAAPDIAGHEQARAAQGVSVLAHREQYSLVAEVWGDLAVGNRGLVSVSRDREHREGQQVILPILGGQRGRWDQLIERPEEACRSYRVYLQ